MCLTLICVRLIGLEPTRRETPDPKSGASTNSATSAFACAKVMKKGGMGKQFLIVFLLKSRSSKFFDKLLHLCLVLLGF